MKAIRNLLILAGLFVGLVALGAPGARAEVIPLPFFTGSFTLPVQTQWGSMTLPAGHYRLYYGQAFRGGIYAVDLLNTTSGVHPGLVLVQARTTTSALKNELICTREGNVDVVRSLELPALRQSIHFALPHGMQLMASRQNHNANVLLADAQTNIERIPVQMIGK